MHTGDSVQAWWNGSTTPECRLSGLGMEPGLPGNSQAIGGILIADDSEYLRTAIGRLLREEGFAVWLVEDGQAAIELYRREMDHISLVLLDVSMPRLNGPTTLEKLKQLNPTVRCCFMSGDLSHYPAEELLRQGAREVFRKPFLLTDFLESLRKLALSN